jgi:hypothetical protein
MNGVRTTFIDASLISRDLIASPDIARRWDEPSALELFAIRGLAGHLVRATGSVEIYLDRPEPTNSVPISAADYYAAAVETNDLASDLHVAIRQRGEDMAAEGHAALVARLDATIERLRDRLEREPESRLMMVHKDLIVRLDDYLVTRLVELTVHIDDLAVSVGLDTPEMPPDALDVAIDNLVDVARLRHGDIGVLRALTRRERDQVEALRVL